MRRDDDPYDLLLRLAWRTQDVSHDDRKSFHLGSCAEVGHLPHPLDPEVCLYCESSILVP